MKTIRKRITLLLTCALSVVTTISTAVAGPSLVFDIKTGEILHEEDASASWHPASLTKVMTAHLAIKAIKDGQLTLNSKVTISHHAASQPPSKLGLKPGQSLSLHEALRIMLTRSTNDIATAIAEAVSGNEQLFAQAMTIEAKSLGMMATRFSNANGLHEPSQVTTARDLAILATTIHEQHPEFLYLFGIKEMKYGKQVLRNTNSMLRKNPSVSGMKTGYICASGFNVITTFNFNNRKLGAIVLGEPSVKRREEKVGQVLSKALKANNKHKLNIKNYAIRQESPASDLRVEICGHQKIAQANNTSGVKTSLKTIPVPSARPNRKKPLNKRF